MDPKPLGNPWERRYGQGQPREYDVDKCDEGLAVVGRQVQVSHGRWSETSAADRYTHHRNLRLSPLKVLVSEGGRSLPQAAG